MKEIKINDEYFQKYEDRYEFKDHEFGSDDEQKEMEIRIPFQGYYSIKADCKDPQVAMAAMLQFHREAGVMDIVGAEQVIDYELLEETYVVMEDDESKGE